MIEDNGWVREAKPFWDKIDDLQHYLKDLESDYMLCQTDSFADELLYAMGEVRKRITILQELHKLPRNLTAAHYKEFNTERSFQ